ncbi:MAG TPA: lysophospholipid acyltransferase family protein [Candidatus Acidoferrales bacterium]|nr:lysophospholipid acyltransferase family protein [Candidatus Acidoferrales bacterium]
MRITLIEESSTVRLYYTLVTEPANISPAAEESVPKPRDEAQAISAHYDTRLPELSRWRRMQIPIIASAVYGFVRTLGPSIRYEILGWQHAQRIYDSGRPIIYAFWHRSIFSAMWHWRHRGVVVMNTTNFDGQWTRRVVERLGYGTAQGSSSRGGLKGLAVMARRLEEGRDVAFTIDGPRGPRYIAKPGPVMLARRTGCPIIVFHAGLERAYTFEKSWDLFQLPHAFSRGIILIHPPIEVPTEANAELIERKHAEMQTALERVRDIAESWFSTSADERARLRGEWNA